MFLNYVRRCKAQFHLFFIAAITTFSYSYPNEKWKFLFSLSEKKYLLVKYFEFLHIYGSIYLFPSTPRKEISFRNSTKNDDWITDSILLGKAELYCIMEGGKTTSNIGSQQNSPLV